MPARTDRAWSSSRSTAAPATPWPRPAPTAWSGPTWTCSGPAQEPIQKSTDTTVLATLENGVGGSMPKGILQGAQAKAVAHFVADNVQYVPGP